MTTFSWGKDTRAKSALRIQEGANSNFKLNRSLQSCLYKLICNSICLPKNVVSSNISG